MNNYQDMTNAQLDTLSAVRLMSLKLLQWQSSNSDDVLSLYLNEEGKAVFSFDEWNPTHPDSNQAERYLFPKVRELDSVIRVFHGLVSYIIRVVMDLVVSKDDCFDEIEKDGQDFSQINRTKTIACLEAWDKLNQSGGESNEQ